LNLKEDFSFLIYNNNNSLKAVTSLDNFFYYYYNIPIINNYNSNNLVIDYLKEFKFGIRRIKTTINNNISKVFLRDKFLGNNLSLE